MAESRETPQAGSVLPIVDDYEARIVGLEAELARAVEERTELKVERNGYEGALRTIRDDGDGPWRSIYEDAGGGYRGLRAVAGIALSSPAAGSDCVDCGHPLAGHRGDGVCLHCGCETRLVPFAELARVRRDRDAWKNAAERWKVSAKGWEETARKGAPK